MLLLLSILFVLFNVNQTHSDSSTPPTSTPLTSTPLTSTPPTSTPPSSTPRSTSTPKPLPSKPLRCGHNLTAHIIWEAPVGGPGSPFAASPIILPLDSTTDSSSPSLIVAAAFHGEVTVVKGETGAPLPSTQWPVHLPSASVYASPVVHDVDGDGRLDVMVVTGEGVVHAWDLSGLPLPGRTFSLPSVFVPHRWWLSKLSLTFPEVERIVAEGNASGRVELTPHVLATPVVRDLDDDGDVREMILPVTYYLEQDVRCAGCDGGVARATDYLLSSLVLVDIETQTFSRQTFLELTRKNAEFPAYLLHPPTIVDLDSRSGPLEVVIASGSGQIFAFDHELQQLRLGFPLEVDSVAAPIVAHDLTGNGRLELVAADRSGNINCFDTKGKLIWDAALGTNVLGHVRIAEVDAESEGEEILISSLDGNVTVLGGGDGKLRARWSVGSEDFPLASGLLITRLLTKPDFGPPDVFALSTEGHLHVLTSSGEGSSDSFRCHELIDLKESTLVAMLSGDFVYQSRGHELLVATRDGLLIALSVKPVSLDPSHRLAAAVDTSLQSESSIMSWSADVPFGTTFAFQEPPPGLSIKDWTRSREHVIGEFLSVSFEVGFASLAVGKELLRVKVLLGSRFLVRNSYTGPGFHHIRVPCPDRPISGHLQLRLTNQHGQLFVDAFPVSLNESLLTDLKWILLVPLLAMVVTWLIVHGYPEEEMLPTTVFKGK